MSLSRHLPWLLFGLLFGCGTLVELEQGSGGYPHQDDYVRQHGEDAEDDDSACLACHGEDEDHMIEGSQAPHCSQCHAYPPDFDTGPDTEAVVDTVSPGASASAGEGAEAR